MSVVYTDLGPLLDVRKPSWWEDLLGWWWMFRYEHGWLTKAELEDLRRQDALMEDAE
jgi:hypothetical protein